jgi:hypothetical protein
MQTLPLDRSVKELTDKFKNLFRLLKTITLMRVELKLRIISGILWMNW